MSRPMANLLLLVAGAVWGMGFVAQSTAMDAIGPFLFIGLRFLVASIVVAPLALREMRNAPVPVSPGSRRGFIAIGLTLFAGMGMQQVGLLSTSVTNSGFLTGLYVIFTPIITLLVLRLRPHILVWPAVLMTFAGIFLLAGGQAEPFTNGDYLTVGCALLWAVQMILVGRYATESNRPYSLSLCQFAITAFLGLGVALALEPLDAGAVAAAMPEILFAGVVASGIGFTLQVVAQRYTTAPQAAIFLSTESLFAALFGALLLGEIIQPIGYAGGMLIFLAIILVEVGPAMMARKPV